MKNKWLLKIQQNILNNLNQSWYEKKKKILNLICNKLCQVFLFCKQDYDDFTLIQFICQKLK